MATLQKYCGSKLFYRRSGSGTPVLLVHGSACTGGGWKGLVTELGEGFSYYTPDLAGYGQSSCDYLKDVTSLRDEAEFIGSPVLDFDEPFHLIGHSFGGAVALAVAMGWPGMVKTLTLYEPSAFFVLRDREGEDRKKFDVIRRLADDMRQYVLEANEARAMAIFVDFWNGAGSWTGMTAEQQTALSKLSKRVVDNFRVAFAEKCNPAEFSKLRMPVTIIKGDASPAVALRTAEVVAEMIPHTRRVTVRNAGHMAPMNEPKLVASAFRECLELTLEAA